MLNIPFTDSDWLLGSVSNTIFDYSMTLIIQIYIIRTLSYPNVILSFKIPKGNLIFCEPK